MLRFLILAALWAGNSAFALGTGSSGGGGAFVCRDPQTKAILNSELVDVWEAHALDGRAIEYSTKNYWDQAQDMVNLFQPIDTEMYSRLNSALQYVKTHLYPVPAGVEIEPPNDVDNGYSKEGCPLEGMIYFDGDRDRVAVQQVTFDKLLTETDKAAAMFHEAFYKVMRDQKRPATDSVSTRAMVGCIFSSDTTDCLDSRTAVERLPGNTTIQVCEGFDMDNKMFRLYQWQDGKNLYAMADVIAGISIPAGMLLTTPQPQWGAFNSLVHQGIHTKDQLIGMADIVSTPLNGSQISLFGLSTPFTDANLLNAGSATPGVCHPFK